VSALKSDQTSDAVGSRSETEVSTNPTNWVSWLRLNNALGDAGAVSTGSTPVLQVTPSKVTGVSGTSQCNYQVLICFFR